MPRRLLKHATGQAADAAFTNVRKAASRRQHSRQVDRFAALARGRLGQGSHRCTDRAVVVFVVTDQQAAPPQPNRSFSHERTTS